MRSGVTPRTVVVDFYRPSPVSTRTEDAQATPKRRIAHTVSVGTAPIDTLSTGTRGITRLDGTAVKEARAFFVEHRGILRER